MTSNEFQPQTPPKPPPPPTSAAHIPTRAALCAVVPGVGAVYNREYTKAVVHFSIFACLAIIAESEGIFGLAAASFYFFTIIDAYRTADAIMKRGGFEAVQDQRETINLPVWGGLLILMGIVFLLDNLGAIRIRTAVQFWPLILVALGLYLIFNFFQKHKAEESQARDSGIPQGQGYYAPPPSGPGPTEPYGTASTPQNQGASSSESAPPRDPDQGDS